jgi:hypothetical protein
MQLTKTITFSVETAEIYCLLPYKNGHWVYLANIDELCENTVMEFLEMNVGDWYCGRAGGTATGDWAICSGMDTNDEDSFLKRLRDMLHLTLTDRLQDRYHEELSGINSLSSEPNPDTKECYETSMTCLNGIQEYCEEFNPFDNNDVMLQWEDDDQELTSY